MADFITVESNIGEFADMMGQAAATMPAFLSSVTARIRSGIHGILREGLFNAVNQAGPGFPAQYADHLAEGVMGLEVNVYETGSQIVIEIGDPQGLGDYAALEQGFHYHALEDTGEAFAVSAVAKMELPYEGQALINDGPHNPTRLAFWEALVAGIPYPVRFNGHTKSFSTAGLYDETIAARVAYWRSANVYPEWLILEYGTETVPIVQPTHFTQLLQIRVEEYMNTVMAEVADDLALAIDSMKVGVNSAGRPYDVLTGRFAKYIK